VRLRDSSLRRMFDSMDICQSVLGSFFVRAASGQFDLEKPQQLINLLVTMARNRLTNRALHEQAARRDHRRTQSASGPREVPDASPSPSDVVAGAELLQEVRRRLTPEEQKLADERFSGKPWTQMAVERGASADALRMQLSRALDRVTQELKLED
jgi:RNA polymerase sigma-70 factor (ECF subfamily)